jgi:hypothetical protein
MVRIHPDPPKNQDLQKSDVRTGASGDSRPGAIAQLGERLLCKQEVTGSIPVGSTSHFECLLQNVRHARFAVGSVSAVL